MNCYNKEVSVDYPLYQSEKGNYFIGETPIINGQNKHAQGILYNPLDSNRNIYLNAITLTNISAVNLSSEFYLRSEQCDGICSDLVSCTNTSICPPPIHKGEIQYLSPAPKAPNGISIFSRIVPPYSTLVVDGGQIILAPGQSISVYIGGFLPASFSGIRFAFGWWEEKKQPYCY